MESNCETETEEQEEYTAIYKVSRRKHTRTRTKSSNKPKQRDEKNPPKETALNPFLEGHLPEVVKDSFCIDKESLKTNAKHVSDFSKASFRNLSIPNILGQRNKVFLGECSDEEDLGEDTSRQECAVLKSVRIWKLRQTGRRGYDRFRRSVEFVRFAKKICTRTGQTLSDEESRLFFIDKSHKTSKQTGCNIANSPDPCTLFDITPYQALGQKNFVKTVRNCLEIPPSRRACDDITAMMNMLRKFSKFTSYPKHVQRGICTQGWYSKFDKAKVLVREGNRADVYYFLLAGVAVSRCLDYEEDAGAKMHHFVEFHRQGDVIGEREILTNSERPMTIVCKESVEVIGLDKEELLELFQSSGAPESISFLKKVPDLFGFPFQLLQTYHFSCSVHHYRRGAVIVKDSNESEWIYVIKSGSCQVYESVTRSRDKPTKLGPTPPRSHVESCLPDISNKTSPVPKPRRASSTDMSGPCRSKSKLAPSPLTRQKTVLPTINAANNLLSQQNSSPESTPRRKPKTNHTSSTQTDNPRTASSTEPTFYVKLGILTERECFGLQSLIYKNVPSLSLVSNGAECVLLSKQFFRDHMDDDLRKRLIYRVPPYPSDSQVRDAVEDKLLWDLYKNQVLQNVMSK